MNIILIVCNALRKSNLGCYGYPLKTSTYIDRFASKSLVFDSCRTISSQTDPSFASIETGTLNHGIVHHANEIKNEELEQFRKLPTLAETLQEHGWYTVGLDFLGRFHKRGFDHYMGIVAEKRKRMRIIESIRRAFRINPGSKLQTFLEKTPLYNAALKLLFSHRTTPYLPADRLTNKAISWVQEIKPLFLFIHYWDTHIPYWPPKDYEQDADYSKLYKHTDLRLSEIRKNISAPLRKFFFDCMMYDKKTVYDCLKAYDGEIRFIDKNLERLFKVINWQDTIVVLTADHGESLVEEGFFIHEGVTHKCVRDVPLILYYPFCKRERVKKKVTIADIAPTICKLVNVDFKGRSLI